MLHKLNFKINITIWDSKEKLTEKTNKQTNKQTKQTT